MFFLHSPALLPYFFYLFLDIDADLIAPTFILFFFYMPQLVPFYFLNQITFAFILLIVMTYTFSKYILPRFVRLFTTRVFISKL